MVATNFHSIKGENKVQPHKGLPIDLSIQKSDTN